MINLILWLVVGGVLGWIASMIMGTDAQQGILLNIIVGVVGAVLGGFLWGLLTHDPDPYKFWSMGSWVTARIAAAWAASPAASSACSPVTPSREIT